jgi:putative ABC transport system permease protein
MPESLELKRALRSLRRSPLFLATTTLTLALGIGAATAIFGVVNAVLLRPLPYPEADRLVVPYHTLQGLGIPFAGQSRGTFFQYQRTVRSFQSIAGYRPNSVNLEETATGGEAERLDAASITANLLSTLGVSPERGRGFSAAEDQPNGDRVALISDGLWRRRFGADPAILDRTIRVNGSSYRVVGVMPPSFRFPAPSTELWLALQLDAASPNAEGFNIAAVARLATGATIAGAGREINVQLVRLPEAYPNIYPGMSTAAVLAQAKARAEVRSLRDQIVGDFARVLWVIAATVVLVLIVTCANVGNLLLVRAEGRTREIAVRSALGATRRRLLAHFLAEGTLLAGAGGVIGFGVAVALTRLLLRAGPANFPRREEIGINGASFAFAFVITAFVAVACSLLPAMRHRSVGIGAMLREGGRAGIGRERHRAQRTLIVVQVALALLVLAGSGLLARTVWQLQQVRPGFDPSHTLAFTVSLPRTQFPELWSVTQYYREVERRLRALPGVDEAGIASKLPLVGGSPLAAVYVERFPVTGNTLPPVFAFPIATPGYFRAMRIPLLAGRLFSGEYPPDAPSEVVVSRAFAEQYWHDPTGQTALGQRLKVSTSERAPWSTIVGVVESVRDTALAGPPVGEVYFPLTELASGKPDSLSPFPYSRVMNVVLRTSGDPLAIAAAARREMRAVNADIPIYDLQPMTAVLDRATARTRFALLALGVAAAITLVLGAVGLYGVIAYVVSLRTHELGLRIALGARPLTVLALVLQDGLSLAIVGVMAGLTAFIAVGRFLRGLLVGVTPTDPWTLAAASILVLLVAALASWIPARHASRIDPLEALRTD